MDETIYFKAVNKRITAIIMLILGPTRERSLEDTGVVMSLRGLTKVSPPRS